MRIVQNDCCLRDVYIIKMTFYFRNAISNLYEMVKSPIVGTKDALANRLRGLQEMIGNAYSHVKSRVYGNRLKEIVEQEVEREDHQDDVQAPVEDADGIEKIKDGTRVKTWRVARNLNQPLMDKIISKVTPDIDMRTKVIYSFKCEVYQGGGAIAPYNKTKGSTGTLTSLQEIKDFIDECEARRLDLGNVGVLEQSILTERKNY